VNPLELLEKQFGANRAGLDIVLQHSRMVADKALAIARGSRIAGLDLDFIEQAALLHDIGVARIYARCSTASERRPTSATASSAVRSSRQRDTRGTPWSASVTSGRASVQDIERQRLPLPNARCPDQLWPSASSPWRPLLLQEGGRPGQGESLAQ